MLTSTIGGNDYPLFLSALRKETTSAGARADETDETLATKKP
jgi:hypothetical protein